MTARRMSARSCCAPKENISAPVPISAAAAPTASRARPSAGRHLYKEAQRLWRTGKPIVAAVHGAAVGAGVGLAVMADFRVTCPEARFSTNFTRLGFHPGFGLTATLPRLIGEQQAALLLYTGRRMTGEEALAIGLADYCVPQAEVRAKAIELATEIGQSAPLAIVATRETLRRGLAEAVARRPSANTRNRTGCATPPTSRKAPRRWPNAGCRTFRRAERDRLSQLEGVNHAIKPKLRP